MVARTDTHPYTLGSLLVAAAVLASTALATPALAAAPTDAAPSSATTPAARGAQTFYVSPHGNDQHHGGARKPLRTIQAAIDRSRPGGTVVVRPGRYHESLKFWDKAGLTVRASRPGKVQLDGTSRVEHWERSGRVWVRHGWHHQFDASPTFTWGAPDNTQANWSFVNPAHPMAAHPDQVFVDGHALRQVASLSQVHGRRFYVDYASHQLFIGTNPENHAVRASTLAKAMSIQSAGVTVDGFVVNGFAPSVPNMGGITLESPHDTLRHMVVQNTSTIGAFAGSTDARLDHVTFRHNGLLGFMATYADGLQVNRVNVVHNNIEKFNMSPSAGGAKIGRTDGVVVRHSSFRHNDGTGLWFDESTYKIRVIGSRMVDNANHGLSLEVSGHAAVIGNVIADNTNNGIKVNDTDHVQLWNNTFVGNTRPIAITQDGRDLNPAGSYHDTSLPLPWVIRNISVVNNIIARSPRSDCLLCVQDYTGRFSAAALHVTATGNVYQRRNKQAPSQLVLWSRGAGSPAVYSTIRDFRAATGQERSHLLLTGRGAVDQRYVASASVRRAAKSVAVPLSSWAAHVSQQRVGVRWLGSWLR